MAAFRSLPLSSVNMACLPEAKSHLTEKLPLCERRGFAGFGAAICCLGCGADYSDSGTGNVARTGSPDLGRHSIPISERLAHVPLPWQPICSVASGFEQTRYRGTVLATKALI